MKLLVAMALLVLAATAKPLVENQEDEVDEQDMDERWVFPALPKIKIHIAPPKIHIPIIKVNPIGAIKAVVGGAVDAAVKADAAVKGAAAAALNAAGSVAGALEGDIKIGGGTIGGGKIDVKLPDVGAAINVAGNAAANLANGALNAGLNLANGAVNVAGGAANASLNLAGGVANAGLNLANGAANAGLNLANGAVNVAGGAANAGLNLAGGVANAGLNLAGGAANAGINVAADAAGAVDGAIKGAIKGSLNLALGGIGGLLDIGGASVQIGLNAADFAAKMASGSFKNSTFLVVLGFSRLPAVAMDGLASIILKAEPASLSAVAVNENNIAIDLGAIVDQCQQRPECFDENDVEMRGVSASATNTNNIRISGINKVCDALKQKKYY